MGLSGEVASRAQVQRRDSPGRALATGLSILPGEEAILALASGHTQLPVLNPVLQAPCPLHPWCPHQQDVLGVALPWTVGRCFAFWGWVHMGGAETVPIAVGLVAAVLGRARGPGGRVGGSLV